MRPTILAAVGFFVIGAAAGGAILARAQPASLPSVVLEHAPLQGPGDRMHRMRGFGGGPGPGTFSLVYRQQDRQLTPADVGKIAEAFLVWQGNHTWKVIDVAATQEGPVGFSLATPDGSVIARFTMDPHTGRVTRLG